MKYTHFATLALAAALTATVGFAQQPTDKPEDSPKAHSTEKAVKPEHGSVKAQEAGQEKTKTDKTEARDSKLPQSDQEPGVRNPEAEKNDKPVAKDEKADRKDADKARMPQSDQEQGDRKEGDRNEARKAEPSEHDRNTHFQIKQDGREKVREHYKSEAAHVNHSVTITREQVLPVEVQTIIQPVPMDLVGYLGPAPEGFMYGYADGYVFVYDPNTFWVVDVFPVF